MSDSNKIRILILINELLRGGAQRIVADIAMGIDKSKFDLKVVYMKRHDMFQEGGMDTLLDELKDTGVDVICLDGNKSLSLHEIVNLYKLLREYNPDILHTFLPYSGTLGRVVGVIAGVKNIISTQCNLPNAYTRRTYWLDLLTLPIAKVWTAASESIEVAYAGDAVRFSDDEWENSNRKHFTVVAGVNIHEFKDRLNKVNKVELRKQEGIPLEVPLVMTIARFVTWKGCDDLIDSMQYLPKDVHLALIGWGPMGDELKSKVQDLGIQERVHFLGIRSDYVELLGIANVYAQTHKFSIEKGGWSGPNTSQMSACAANVPSVSTAVPLVEYLIEDMVTGVLAQPNNPKDIARAIEYLLKNPTMSESFVKRAYERVINNYSIESMIRAYQDIYVRLFNNCNSYGS